MILHLGLREFDRAERETAVLVCVCGQRGWFGGHTAADVVAEAQLERTGPIEDPTAARAVSADGAPHGRDALQRVAAIDAEAGE